MHDFVSLPLVNYVPIFHVSHGRYQTVSLSGIWAFGKASVVYGQEFLALPGSNRSTVRKKLAASSVTCALPNTGPETAFKDLHAPPFDRLMAAGTVVACERTVLTCQSAWRAAANCSQDRLSGRDAAVAVEAHLMPPVCPRCCVVEP